MHAWTVKRAWRAASIAGALVIAGCSGNAAPLLAPLGGMAMPHTSQTQVRLSVTFPAQATTGSAARRPAYISKSIASLSFSINGGAPTILNAPRPTGSPQTVTSTVDAPPGTDTFAIAEYDSTDGVGNLLGRTIQTRSIVAGTINNIGFTLDGQLAKIAIQSVPDPFVEGSIASGITLVGAAPHAFVAIPQDADGNTIVMPGAVPKIAVASANASAIVAATGDGNTFTLAAPAPTGPIAISVSATDLDGKTVSAAPLQTRALGAFYIADFTVQLIRAFDENGTPLALAPTAFANVTNPEGLAYIPGSPGTIVVTESANPGAPYVVAYDLAGNSRPLPSSAFAGLSRPLFLTYAPSADAGKFFVPDYFTNSLSVFDANGNAVPLASGSFAQLLNPVAATYDPHNAQVYVTSGGADTLAAYTTSGASKGRVTVGSHPMGAVFDANNNSVYVAYAGTLGAAIDMQSAQMAGISQVSEGLAVKPNQGGFATTSPSTLYTGIEFDPYTKQLYVADAGNSRIVAFSEAGVPVVLPLGAFGTISSTTRPPGDPMAILFVP